MRVQALARRRYLVGLAAAAVPFMFNVSSAAACNNEYDIFNPNGYSRVYQDYCGHFNIDPTGWTTYSLGQYESGSSWFSGAAGWQWRYRNSWTQPPLITGLGSGVNVRAAVGGPDENQGFWMAVD
jgi:hypothetical protein